MLSQIKKNQDVVLAILAVIFLGGIIWSYVWGIKYLLASLTKAVVIEKGQNSVVQFDLENAKKILSDRGLE